MQCVQYTSHWSLYVFQLRRRLSVSVLGVKIEALGPLSGCWKYFSSKLLISKKRANNYIKKLNIKNRRYLQEFNCMALKT